MIMERGYRQLYSLLDHVQDALVTLQHCCDQMRALMRPVWVLHPGKGCSCKDGSLVKRAVAVCPRSKVGAKSEDRASNRDRRPSMPSGSCSRLLPSSLTGT